VIGSKCEMVLGEGMPRALNIISDLARPFDFAHLSISSNDLILDVLPMSASVVYLQGPLCQRYWQATTRSANYTACYAKFASVFKHT